MQSRRFALIALFSTFLVLVPPVFAVDKEAVARLINEGMTYHANRNYLLAIRSFRQALDLDSTNLQIQNNLSIVHNNYGKYLAERTDGDGAAREFRNALYYNSKNDIARSNLEYKLQELKIDTKDHIKRIMQARQERLRENFYAAIAELQEANRIKPTAEAYLEIGSNYHLLNLKSVDDSHYFDYAVDAFNKAATLAPNDPRPFIRLGDLHIAVGKINLGIDNYEQAIKIAPSNGEAQDALINGWLAAIRVAPHLANNHVGLGTAYQLKGDFLQAERSFRRALQIDATNQLAVKGLDTLKEDQIKTQISLFMDRAVSFQKQANYDQSLANYIKALNLDPLNADIHYNIGTAFQAKNDLIRARKAYHRATELKSGHLEARQALAILDNETKERQVAEAFMQAVKFQEAANYTDAIKIYNKILVDKPNDDALHYNLAVAYQAQGNYNEALSHYKQASLLKADKTYTDAIKSAELAKANALLREAIEAQSGAENHVAIAKYEEVVTLVPNNANAWYNLGTAYQAVAKDGQALDAYTRAYTLDEKNQTEAIFFAALILEEQRKLLEAIKLYDKYLVIMPKGDYAKEARERQEYIKSFL